MGTGVRNGVSRVRCGRVSELGIGGRQDGLEVKMGVMS